MVTSHDFTLASVLTAMFTPEHSVFSTGRATATILRQFGDQFSGDIQALPLPKEIPPELPRVVLQSTDGLRRLNLGPARFDSVWTRQHSESDTPLADVVRKCVEVQEHYVGATNTRVGRVALMLRRVCLTENPAQTLIQQFCNEKSQREPFNRSATFEIHNHKEYYPRRDGIDYQINSWVRCKCGKTAVDNRPIIIVEQDLNTMAAELEQRRFDVDQIRAFFDTAVLEADGILEKYFPG